MSTSNINVSFPCPRCGMVLQIPNFTAIGPCPSCQTNIKMELSVTIADGQELADAQPDQPRKHRFADRTMKANARPTAPLQQKAHHPPSDWR